MLKDVLRAFRQQDWHAMDVATHELFAKYGYENLVDTMIDAFPQIKSWKGRKAIMYWLVRSAGSNSRVARLAVAATKDRSALVREDACRALRETKNKEYLEVIKILLDDKSKNVRDSAARALHDVGG